MSSGSFKNKVTYKSYIYIYIYILDICIFNSWNLDCDSSVSMEFFAKQQSSGSKENEINQKSKKYSQKTVGVL